MRIGNYHSRSYRRLSGRRKQRKTLVIRRLCKRLDALVEYAEKFSRGTRTRAGFMARAEKVREKLREIDH
jgi:hypothetical protein